jgi:formamidopyrimidine-DNA glycosylase
LPELPEVETVVSSLQPIAGRRILNVEVRQQRVVRGDLARAVGRRIVSISRRGKFIVMALEPAGYLLVHLGMTGKLLTDGEITKHTHIILTLDRGTLTYTDSRQFGRMEYTDAAPGRIEKLGPEPLIVSFEEFAAALKARHANMKALLLNQRFLAGVGNIYADEALFRAGIHPRTISSKISRPRARVLYEAIREVLSEAIAAKGSSVSDYVDADGNRGNFQDAHRVYRRTGEPCVKCGAPIRRTLVTQRGTHFCAKCQKR